jgi:excisionase family DNA binding protein
MPEQAHGVGSDALVGVLNALDQRLASVEQVVVEIRQQVQHGGTAKEWYSTAEVATLVGKAEFTARMWCLKRRMRAEKTENGREWRVHRDELQRYAKEGLLPLPPNREQS